MRSVVAGAVIAAALLETASAFYLPGVAPRAYVKDELLPVSPATATFPLMCLTSKMDVRCALVSPAMVKGVFSFSIKVCWVAQEESNSGLAQLGKSGSY
jgi:hypothetical protein